MHYVYICQNACVNCVILIKMESVMSKIFVSIFLRWTEDRSILST